MKFRNRIAIALTLVLVTSAATAVAQTQQPDSKTRQRTSAPTTTQDKDKQAKPANGERLEPDDTARPVSDVPPETQANRVEQMSEEAAVHPYYSTFLNTYRLGPDDVISVTVFNQDRYSRSGITIPPSGRISLSLIPGGIFVNGKTVDEVADIIKKRYDEYIIDPQVS